MSDERREQPSMYVASMDACVDRWFKTYEQPLDAQARQRLLERRLLVLGERQAL